MLVPQCGCTKHLLRFARHVHGECRNQSVCFLRPKYLDRNSRMFEARVSCWYCLGWLRKNVQKYMSGYLETYLCPRTVLVKDRINVTRSPVRVQARVRSSTREALTTFAV